MDITVRILRYNPEKDDKPYFREYGLKDASPDWRLLDVLHEIKWKQDGTLTFRR